MRNGALWPVLLLWSLAGHSQDRGTQYVDAFPYFVEPHQDRGVAGQGAGLRGAFGWILGDQWSTELQGFASVLETDRPGATDYYQLGLGMDLVRAFGEQSRTHPFTLVGAGAVYDDVLPDRDDSINPFVNAALGVTSGYLTDSGLRLRGEVRYLYDLFEQRSSIWRLAGRRRAERSSGQSARAYRRSRAHRDQRSADGSSGCGRDATSRRLR